MGVIGCNQGSVFSATDLLPNTRLEQNINNTTTVVWFYPTAIQDTPRRFASSLLTYIYHIDLQKGPNYKVSLNICFILNDNLLKSLANGDANSNENGTYDHPLEE